MDELPQREFLERTPPGVKVYVTDLAQEDRFSKIRVGSPEIELHCATCGGNRYFFSQQGGVEIQKDGTDDFLFYRCRNCRKSFKTFAVACVYDTAANKWVEFKYGEDPAFGPPTPSRTITLIGPDRDQFLKGRRCENQGLGVGAFVYYRRVVENQKSRIFDEILRVSQHLSADSTLIAEIEAAKKEVQFTKAVDTIRHALPQSLLINGHNPLTLLHSALSSGVHELSDEQCLEMATSIRVVLIEFSERLGLAMKDEAELNEAVSKLANRKAG